jgi:hypothetical protein
MKPRYFFPLFLLALFIASPVFAAEKSADKPQFHPPQTEAEKALDHILQLDHADTQLAEFAVKDPGYDRSKTSAFSHLFTQPLLGAWEKGEKDSVSRECGGKYKDGWICGMDINPISCSTSDDDWPDEHRSYLYRAIKRNTSEVILTYKVVISYTASDARRITQMLPDSKRDRFFYRMVKDKDRWKLDGVVCDNYYHFNMK